MTPTPLVKMTRQVRAGVKSSHKGTPDVLLKDEIHRAEKEVVFPLRAEGTQPTPLHGGGGP